MKDDINMLLNLNVNQAIEFLESPKIIREDQVIPGHFRPCPASPYGAGFDWLYRYEHSITAFFESLLNFDPSDLIGKNSLLHEALVNAFCHAHHRNTLKPINVRFMMGDQGLIIRVSDCGKGFNVQKIYRQYRKKRRYLTSVGNGIRSMAASIQYGTFYNDSGTAFYLIFPFEKKLTDLPSDKIAAMPEGEVEEAA
jgi:anti-sigma regulatory factor (Ser/Thr protein kinase)